MRIKKGQYYWRMMRGEWAIFKADKDSDNIRTSASGSKAFNEGTYSNVHDAIKRCFELNGWKYTPYKNSCQ